VSSTRDPSFLLDRIAIVGRDEIQVAGGWHGVDAAQLHGTRLLIRVGAVSGSVTAAAERWSARFSLTAARDLLSLQLELGDGLVVDLPWEGHPRRRFGRTRLLVHHSGGARTTARTSAGSAADPSHDAPERLPAPERRTAADEPGLLDLHGAVLAARDQLAGAMEQLEAARADARRAQEDAERARSAREREAARAHEAIAGVRTVAEQAVSQERAKTVAMSSAHDAVVEERDAARAEALELRRRFESVERDKEAAAAGHESRLSEARSELEATQQELAALKERETLLGVALSSAREETRRLSNSEAHLEQAQQALEQERQQRERAEAEAARLRGELETGRETAQQTDAEIRRLAAALHDLDQQLVAERARAADALDAARSAADDTTELERQRDAARAELRACAEMARRREALAASVPGLEEELRDARQRLAQAGGEAERLRDRLQAIRSALQNDS
jgi:hypothetical protein